ncbi:hypothetical protein HMPREF1153_2532 [Selenomonas sp. CM52]|nr:hypothetical protein HMPREF1153_2532 [Selenomonas sp. CM52]
MIFIPHKTLLKNIFIYVTLKASEKFRRFSFHLRTGVFTMKVQEVKPEGRRLIG